ncbi:MAG: hypothetical protein RR448_02570 [Niameybacter sp.]|uniref:hypothetical protein n=2 Tax=Niameybacter sp. TaxID=2033640 RepID=UPI002FC76CF4
MRKGVVQMVHPSDRTKVEVGTSLKHNKEKQVLDTMRKGYQEMAALNLSLSKLYFEVEREVESYYDHATECE